MRLQASERPGKSRAGAGRRAARRALRGVLVGLVGALLGTAILLSGALERFEYVTYDMRARLFPGKPSGEVVTVLLDQDSLDWGRRENGLPWPWQREIYSYIVSFAARAGAKALVFDVVFTESSLWGVYDDESFAASIAGMPGFVGTVLTGDETGSETDWPPGIAEPRIKLQGDSMHGSRGASAIPVFSRAGFAVAELAQAFPNVGNVLYKMDPDSVYRRIRPIGVFDGRTIPSLGLAAWIAGRSSDESVPVRAERQKLIIGELTIPTDGQGNAILRYRGPSKTHRTFNAASIVRSELLLREGEEPEVDPSELEGKYIFFGFSAPGLFDLKSSPTGSEYPGVEVHATMLDNLLTDGFIRPVPGLLVVLAILVLAIAVGIPGAFVSGGAANVALYPLFLPLPVLVSFGLYAAGFWMPLAAPFATVLAVLIGSNIVAYMTEGRQKRFIKSAFRQYLSPAVIERLIADPKQLRLGGEKRELSMYFSDLQGFTSLSEKLTPEDLTALLNEYLSAMTEIIQNEGGTVDKFEGDAIIAFWNAPLTIADHARRAVRASLRCQAELARLRPAFRERTGVDLFMRIGLNTGFAVVGNMGSSTRFDYTMLGDAVNLAARLEGINKQFGTYTMISKATRDMMDGLFPARELARVAVVGKKEAVTVYEPMTEEEYTSKADTLEVFARGLSEFYAGRFREAAEIFRTIEHLDPPAKAYRTKCESYPEDGAGPDWNGVWVMTSK